MTVKGHNILGPQGIPFLAPWANRLDEQAFYANGKRYALDMQLGNVRGAHPIHGFLAAAKWEVVEAKVRRRFRVGHQPPGVLQAARLDGAVSVCPHHRASRTG